MFCVVETRFVNSRDNQPRRFVRRKTLRSFERQWDFVFDRRLRSSRNEDRVVLFTITAELPFVIIEPKCCLGGPRSHLEPGGC